ncbi:BON domain-containing protein [Nitrosomonas eutropha]|nr:BON domain-containing protein [Nitrosomonas eutropha]
MILARRVLRKPFPAIIKAYRRIEQDHGLQIEYRTQSSKVNKVPLGLKKLRGCLALSIIRENLIMTMTQLNNNFFTFFLSILIISLLGCAPTAKQSGTGEYIDDSVITTKIKAAIFNEPTLKSAEINVETFKGVVQLSGFVSSRAHANKAVEVARSVAGVKSVKNDMLIK